MIAITNSTKSRPTSTPSAVEIVELSSTPSAVEVVELASTPSVVRVVELEIEVTESSSLPNSCGSEVHWSHLLVVVAFVVW